MFLCTLLVVLAQTSKHRRPPGEEHLTAAEITEDIRRAKENPWVVVLAVDLANYNFFSNWAAHYSELGLAYPVHVFADDEEALQRLHSSPPPGLKLTVRKSAGYKISVKEKAPHIRKVLEEGYNVIFTESNVVWLGDPVKYAAGFYHMWIMVETDNYMHMSPFYGTGIVLALSTRQVQTIITEWHDRVGHVQNQQNVFNEVLRGGKSRSLALRHVGLPMSQFPNGRRYFDRMHEQSNKPIEYDRKLAVAVNNNYIQGYDAKLNRLKTFGLWKAGDLPPPAFQQSKMERIKKRTSTLQPPTDSARPKPASVPAPLSVKMPGKWIVLVAVNQAYYDFFLNWATYYHAAGCKYPVHVYAEDAGVMQLLRHSPPPGLDITVRTVKSRANMGDAFQYGSKGFGLLMAARATRILAVLEEGYNIIFADTDTVWLDDPLKWAKGDYHIWTQIDTDSYEGFRPYYCPGQIIATATEPVIAVMREWERRLKNAQTNQMLYNVAVHKFGPKAGLRHAPLPRQQFPSGKLYFEKKHEIEKVSASAANYDRTLAVTVHNNYIQGHDAKLARFKKFGLWKGPKKADELRLPEPQP